MLCTIYKYVTDGNNFHYFWIRRCFVLFRLLLCYVSDLNGWCPLARMTSSEIWVSKVHLKAAFWYILKHSIFKIIPTKCFISNTVRECNKAYWRHSRSVFESLCAIRAVLCTNCDLEWMVIRWSRGSSW